MGIKVQDIKEKNKMPVALCLGYFDSVHNGHYSLIKECILSGYATAVFTFANNPKTVLGNDEKQIYTLAERIEILSYLGVDLVIKATAERDFMDMSGQEYLDLLFENYNIKLLVIGSDFKCGKNAIFGANEIAEYCKIKGIKITVKEMLLHEGRKIASSDIREMLREGLIEEVNKLLPIPFNVKGTVKGGRNIGGKVLGYPTANIDYPDNKVIIKEGVYKTLIRIDNKEFPALTNVGCHPTFNDYHYNIESFILNFDKDIYECQITVYFLEYLRGVKTFENVESLKKQIDYDISRVIGTLNVKENL